MTELKEMHTPVGAPAESRPNWVASRLGKTSDSLDRAFEEGLTGHVITARDGKRIQLDDGSEAMEFVLCSYLEPETHPDLIAAATEALRVFGVHFSTSRNPGTAARALGLAAPIPSTHPTALTDQGV
jgi:hypothetical protein